MRLYQHSMRCPMVLQYFLYANPQYWCFVPMKEPQALAENQADMQNHEELTDFIENQTRTTAIVYHYMLPDYILSSDYRFSFRQQQAQRSFFESLESQLLPSPPYKIVDLYKFTTIAVCKCTDYSCHTNDDNIFFHFRLVCTSA